MPKDLKYLMLAGVQPGIVLGQERFLQIRAQILSRTKRLNYIQILQRVFFLNTISIKYKQF